MKRMVYMVISAASVLLAVIIFAGCSFSHVPEAERTFMGISVSQSHMNFGACYNFYLREEDGKVLFDAEVRFQEEPYTIILENCQVDDGSFEQLKALDKAQGITDYVISYKKKPELFEAMDKTMNTTTVYLSNGTDKSAESGEYLEELYNFFFELAFAYKAESVAE